MKKNSLIVFLFFLLYAVTPTQAQDSLSSKKWEISADVNFYIFRDDFFILPVLRLDKGVLHLEGRYNYEDFNTFSAWAGYNFKGGKKLEYGFTPMIGGVIGNSNGVAPGLELSLLYKKIEFYSESELFFDVIDTENDFFYTWTDLTYVPKDWLWLGLSIQRTKLYQTELDIQRGFIAGTGFKNWELSSYFFNPFTDDSFFILTLTYNH